MLSTGWQAGKAVGSSAVPGGKARIVGNVPGPPAAAAAATPQQPRLAASGGGWHLEVRVEACFEECLDLRWKVAADNGAEAPGPAPTLQDCVVEIVIDRTDPESTGPLLPAKDAMVKRMEMGNDMQGSIQNMPQCRRFLVSVVAAHGGKAPGKLRSPWVRAATLDPGKREKELSNIDPTDLPRLHCNHCPCVGYVPFRFTANSAAKMRCRRCGCQYTAHACVDALHVLRQREAHIKEQLQRDKVMSLPEEAINWDERECLLFVLSDGEFHPRNSLGEHKKHPAAGSKAGPGGPEGPAGRKGRVTVITPTTEARHRFHQDLWASFQAQDWPDKELIVVETYTSRYSDFFMKLARKEKRLTYIKFKRKAGNDWSIGLKRNLGIHLATGEFIAHFDDDDIYAHNYLSTMIAQLEAHAAHAITLSSWYIFNVAARKWCFCDAIGWGWEHGYDSDHPKVKSWAYGYGFSYVYRRQAALDQPYDDVNMGEDFGFVTQLQRQRCRGDATVALVRDDFGICLHTQHGQNTSETFPIRDVPPEEARDLDVAPLAAAAESHPALREECERQGTAPRSSRPRSLRAVLPKGEVWVDCEAGCTVAAFRQRLQELWAPARDLLVYCVPPPGAAQEGERDRYAAYLLGIPCLAATLESDDDGKAALEQRRLLAHIKRALADTDRLSLRSEELWLAVAAAGEPGPAAEEALEAAHDQVPREETFDVQVTCQRSELKRFSAKEGAVTVRLNVGATVANLRETMDYALPPGSRVLSKQGDLGLVQLADHEPVPAEVTVTEFKGKRAFWVLFGDGDARLIFGMLRDFLRRPKIQTKLDDLEGKPGQFATLLLQLLVSEVYPSILHRLKLPDDHLGGAPVIMEGLAMHRRFEWPLCQHVESGHFELCERWLEVEGLMRNSDTVAFANLKLQSLRERWYVESGQHAEQGHSEPPPPLEGGSSGAPADAAGTGQEEEEDPEDCPWGPG